MWGYLVLSMSLQYPQLDFLVLCNRTCFNVKIPCASPAMLALSVLNIVDLALFMYSILVMLALSVLNSWSCSLYVFNTDIPRLKKDLETLIYQPSQHQKQKGS